MLTARMLNMYWFNKLLRYTALMNISIQTLTEKCLYIFYLLLEVYQTNQKTAHYTKYSIIQNVNDDVYNNLTNR